MIEYDYQFNDYLATDFNFEKAAIDLFHFQYANNIVYQKYVNDLEVDKNQIQSTTDIPFLPVEVFKEKKIHSEYGMTELLSQAYSPGEGRYFAPPWMKILTYDFYNPLANNFEGKGGINVIDLANVHSCAFIQTKDIGELNKDGSFQVLGRFDQSDIRGCNLMVI